MQNRSPHSEGIQQPSLREVVDYWILLLQPEASWGGQWLNAYPFGMAAAYLYSICQNHPFEDGNKRVALDVCLTLLLVNGYECFADPDSLTDFVLEIASSERTKDEVARWLEKNCKTL